MSDPPTVEDLAQRLLQLHAALNEHQAFIVAFVLYLRERPGYDGARFRTLYDEQRAVLGLPETPLEEIYASALQDAVVKGPIQ